MPRPTTRFAPSTSAAQEPISAPGWTGSRPTAGNAPARATSYGAFPHGAHRIIELVHTIHLPVVCSVRGWAAGLGCNLALAADFTVAAADAVFWEPFVDRGFSPDSGSTWLLPRLVGLARAKSMLLLGEKVSGTDAADWGLIHRCVDEAELDDTVAELLTGWPLAPPSRSGLPSRPSITDSTRRCPSR